MKEIIKERAKWYLDNDESFGLFVAELGWEDWMLDLCEDKSSQEDGAEITEKDSRNINDFLRECWEEKEKEKEIEEEKEEEIDKLK